MVMWSAWLSRVTHLVETVEIVECGKSETVQQDLQQEC
jgi:hypothetical protein